jgi:hypothetical protein
MSNTKPTHAENCDFHIAALKAGGPLTVRHEKGNLLHPSWSAEDMFKYLPEGYVKQLRSDLIAQLEASKEAGNV